MAEPARPYTPETLAERWGCSSALRADALLDEGDTDGAAAWRAIVKAIEELQRDRRPGEAVN